MKKVSSSACNLNNRPDAFPQDDHHLKEIQQSCSRHISCFITQNLKRVLTELSRLNKVHNVYLCIKSIIKERFLCFWLVLNDDCIAVKNSMTIHRVWDHCLDSCYNPNSFTIHCVLPSAHNVNTVQKENNVSVFLWYQF